MKYQVIRALQNFNSTSLSGNIANEHWRLMTLQFFLLGFKMKPFFQDVIYYGVR